MLSTLADSHFASDDQLIEGWLELKSHHTRRAYRHDIDRMRAYIKKPLAMIGPSELQRFANSLIDLSTRSRARTLASVKSLFRFAHLNRYGDDTASGIELPVVADDVHKRLLSECEVDRMIAAEPNPRNRGILMVLYYAGLQTAELTAVSWRDVTVRGRQVFLRVGKNGDARCIDISQCWGTIRTLRGAGKPGDPIFRSTRGDGRINPSWLVHLVKEAAWRAGIERPVSPQWLRNSHIAHASRHGASAMEIQRTLGLKTLDSVARIAGAHCAGSSSRYLHIDKQHESPAGS